MGDSDIETQCAWKDVKHIGNGINQAPAGILAKTWNIYP